MGTPAQGPLQKMRREKRRSPPPPTLNHDLEARRQRPRGVYGRRPRSPVKTEKVERTSTSLSEARPGVYGRRPGRHLPPEYMEDAWRRWQNAAARRFVGQPTPSELVTAPTSGVSSTRREPPSRAHDGQRSYELAETRVRSAGRNMGSSDPRVQAAGGRRVNSEGVRCLGL